jgi:hypothetical protein
MNSYLISVMFVACWDMSIESVRKGVGRRKRNLLDRNFVLGHLGGAFWRTQEIRVEKAMAQEGAKGRRVRAVVVCQAGGI